MMRDRLAARGESEATATHALTLVADAFPVGDGDKDPSDVRSWPACAALRPHALSVLEGAPENGETATKASLLLNQLALYFIARAEHSEAEPPMRRVIAIFEKAYGPDHPTVARDLNNLAQLLQATNRLAGAEPLARRAIEICIQSLGCEHPNTQTVFRNHLEILAELKGVTVEALLEEMQRESGGEEDLIPNPPNRSASLRAERSGPGLAYAAQDRRGPSGPRDDAGNASPLPAGERDIAAPLKD